MPCPKSFVQGPEPYLESLGISLPSALGTGEPALIEPGTRAVVNGHFFWVAGASELARFHSTPHAYTGRLLDPSTHEWFDPGPDSPRTEVEGEILLFASAETRRVFEAGDGMPPRHTH